MSKLAILVMTLSLNAFSAHGGWSNWIIWGGHGGNDGKIDNGVGGNSDDPCSETGVIFLEAPNIATYDIEDCRAQCELDEDCMFFVFNTLAASGSDNCGLREFEPSNLVRVNGQRAGFSQQIIENENVVLVGFALKTTSIEECQASCEANPRCRTWSWTDELGNNPMLCVHNYGIADTILEVSETVTSGRKHCVLY